MSEIYIDITIKGMHCASCAINIENNLKQMDGISDVVVNFATSTAKVKIDNTKISPKDIVNKIVSIGYQTELSILTISVPGIHCASCIAKITKQLNSTPGIIDSNVNLATKQATINYIPDIISTDRIKMIITELGYDIKDVSTTDNLTSIEEETFKKQKTNFIISLIFTIPVFIISMLHMEFPYVNWILFALTTVVLVGPGAQFYRGAISSIKRKSADMDTLIAVGTASAYIYSIVATVWPEIFLIIGQHAQVYYEVAAIIITLILMGRMLEARARGSATSAIRRLIGLQPKTATVIKDNTEQQVPVETLILDDIIFIKPGERIPVDGILTEGSSTIDESAITGESIPVDKASGDMVISGTFNKTGSFKYRATKVGKETTLQQIIKLVKDAQGSKAPIQRYADVISGYFVTVVIGLAILTFIIWLIFGPADARLNFALVAFVSVLIIACPCALGLATPTAIMVSTGIGAERGILIKNGESLEIAHKITTLVFDKTGTLTKGMPEVTDVFTNIDSRLFLSYIGSVEKNSEHPLATAIYRFAEKENLSTLNTSYFKAEPGNGILATLENGNEIVAGNKNFLETKGIKVGNFSDKTMELHQSGKTIVYVAINKELAGIIGIADTIKPEAKEVINTLKEMSIEVIMLTGDNKLTAEAIAKQLHINRVLSEILPQDKANMISLLQEEGRIVAMVGDGINDAPALVKANIGIAIGTGTDIAIESADITLIKGNLKSVVEAIKLSRFTLNTIKQNLFFAFIYNVIGIPVAAGILYPFYGILLSPTIAALAMSLSSVSVVTNSLRLRWKRF